MLNDTNYYLLVQKHYSTGTVDSDNDRVTFSFQQKQQHENPLTDKVHCIKYQVQVQSIVSSLVPYYLFYKLQFLIFLDQQSNFTATECHNEIDQSYHVDTSANSSNLSIIRSF